MSSLPLWANLGVFLLASVVIWRAGTRLELIVDKIARRTGIGQAFAGMLLLATSTSLPEVATTVSAVLIYDNASLAVHNLVGGVALQTALLVVADATSRNKGALTSFQPRFVLLIQGVGLIMLLQLVIASASAGGAPELGWFSMWLLLLVVAYVAMAYLTYRYRKHSRWTPTATADNPAGAASENQDVDDGDDASDEPSSAPGAPPLRRLCCQFAGAGALVLVAGWAASGAADSLAEQTGLGSAFLGATFLALATSLPELSTTISASRNGRYATAISNVFGSNAFDVSLLFVADILFLDGSIMRNAASSVVFISALGAVMTCVYLWGLMERANRTVARLGWDSVLALALYATGVIVLYLVW